MSSASTIFALSSGRGPSGVAVIRISGPEARHALEALAGAAPKPRIASLRRLKRPADGALLDEALVLHFAAPRSETGEDMVELHTHGGRAVVAAVLSELAKLEGLRLAEPGEFARRAFENGKLDLVAIEGLADLVAAETEAQRDQAVRQAAGEQSRLYDDWRDRLLKALALAEASLDFADETDIASNSFAQARAIGAGLAQLIESHLADGHRGEILRDGFQVVLAGPPNVGKSSLLNALARRDVAIVSAEPGTTRDALEVRLDLGGYPVVVTDTAGLRTPQGEIEAQGIRRSIAHAGRAQLVLWLVESTGGLPNPPEEITSSGAAIMPVITKGDLVCRPVPGLAPDVTRVSVRTGQGLAELIRLIGGAAASALSQGAPTVITRHRHRYSLEMALEALRSLRTADPERPELGAEDLRHAASALGRLTGRIGAEDVLAEIFGRFCIGK